MPIMVYSELNPRAKLVILSTLDKHRTLYDIGKLWYSNIGRFYNDFIIKQVEKGVKLNYLAKRERKYQANTKRIIKEAVMGIDFKFKDKKINRYVKDYKLKLILFYDELKEFSHPTYLNLDLIKTIANGDPDLACNLDIGFVVQLPFILRYIEKKDKSILRLVLSSMGLDKYYKKLSEFENKNLNLLDKIERRDLFGECCAYIINSYYPRFFRGDEELLNRFLKLTKRGNKNG